MKYLIMLVITLGLAGCGSGSSSSPDAVAKWVEFDNSNVGEHSFNYVMYQDDGPRELSYISSSNTEKQTAVEIKELRGKLTDLTDHFYCYFSYINADGITKRKLCRYIDNADSAFEKREWLYDDPLLEEAVYINSVNSRSVFVWKASSNTIEIRAINLATSKTDDELREISIVGEWTFKTYTFNDNKLISLKSTTSKATCTVTECTEIKLTSLTYLELTDEEVSEAKANTWSGSQGKKTAEVVMSPDHNQLSIMICDVDLTTIKSLTECSFIAGTRKGEAGA